MIRAILFAGSGSMDWRWYLVDEQKGEISLDGIGMEALSGQQYQHLMVLLPGALVGSRRLSVSASSAAEARAEALFALEEEIAASIETVHYALSPPDAGGKRVLSWIDRRNMQQITENLTAAGLKADIVMPDYLALPQPESGVVSMAELGDMVLLRHGGAGASFPLRLQQAMLEPLLQQFGSTEMLELLGKGSIEEKHAQMAVFVAKNAVSGNLLQGEFAARADISALMRYALAVQACVLGAMLLFSALQAVEGNGLRAEANRLRDKTASDMQAAFPDIGRVVDPRSQLRARQRDEDEDFLHLSSLLGVGMRAMPDIVLHSLRFDPSGKGLRAQIWFARYSDLEDLRQAVVGAGGVIREGGSRQAEDGGRIGDIVVMAQ